MDAWKVLRSLPSDLRKIANCLEKKEFVPNDMILLVNRFINDYNRMQLKYDRNTLRREECNYPDASFEARKKMQEAFADATEILQTLALMAYPVKPITVNKMTSTYRIEKNEKETSTDDLHTQATNTNVEIAAPPLPLALTPPQEIPLSQSRRRKWEVNPMQNSQESFSDASSSKRAKFAASLGAHDSRYRSMPPPETVSTFAAVDRVSQPNMALSLFQHIPRCSTNVFTPPTQPTIPSSTTSNVPNKRDFMSGLRSSTVNAIPLPHFESLPMIPDQRHHR